MGDAPAKPLQGISILVVDDNLDALDLLKATLTYYGAFIVTAEDGRGALAQLGRVRVDVIISDISMPGFSGLDFIRAVRALSDNPGRNTPAIALTAFNEPTQRRQALEVGFQAYLLKPFNADALVREIIRLTSPGPVA